MYIIFLIKYEIFFSFLHFFVTTHPLLKTASEKFSPHHLHLSRHYIPPLKVASDSWVCVKGDVSSFFPSLHSPSPWERDGVRILFLSPRNPVFNIFCIAVLYYESTTYIPFLYQSSKIRISFL